MATRLQCTEAEYRADPCPISLSYSTAKDLVCSSPLHAWWYHPRLGGKNKKPNKAMASGDDLDRMLFGGADRIAIIEADDYRTKKAQEARDAAFESGLTPVLARVHEAHLSLATLVREATLKATGYDLATCDHQVMVAWNGLNMVDESARLLDVRCRTRMDAVTDDMRWIFDLKDSSNADPDELPRAICDKGWNIQAAAELEALAALEPHTLGRARFADIVVEDGGDDKPSCVTVFEVQGSLLEHGRLRWERAKRRWAECLRDNDWPGYSSTIVTGECPPWEMAKEKAHGW